jgi:hypothetical protein
MHPVDRAAGLALRWLPDGKQVFSRGWGDEAALALLDITAAQAPHALEVMWGPISRHTGHETREGRFAAPLPGLPPAAGDGHVLRVDPSAGGDAVCVMLPAWNDEGYATRLRFATRLAAAGIASYLLEAPFYGRRRATPGRSPVQTVADFALLSRSVVEEGRSLVAALAADGRRVGVAGYSMGGSLAATVGATLDLPMAIAPLAAAHAPAAVFTEGVIRNAVAWDALGTGAQGRLAELLLRPSLLRIPPTPSTRDAILVAATGDGFVPPDVTRAIHEHWPGSELRWVRAGHATLLWRRIDVLVAAIVDAFSRSRAWG